MPTTITGPTQLTLEHYDAQQRHERGDFRPPKQRWRDAQHAAARDSADRASQITDPAKERAMDRLVQLLRQWLGTLRVGDQVAAIDLITWIDRTGVRASLSPLDPRAIGSIAMRIATKDGWLEDVGIAPNGGSDRSNSSPRCVYRVMRVPSIT